MSSKILQFPIRVSEGTVRLVAAQVFGIAVVAAVLEAPVLMALLAVDFALRAFVTPAWSPLALSARKLLGPLLPIGNAPIFFAPKRFAAGIGFMLSIAAAVSGAVGSGTGFILITGILALFSFLEASIRFCAGCWIYARLIRIGIIDRSNCPECAE